MHAWPYKFIHLVINTKYNFLFQKVKKLNFVKFLKLLHTHPHLYIIIILKYTVYSSIDMFIVKKTPTPQILRNPPYINHSRYQMHMILYIKFKFIYMYLYIHIITCIYIYSLNIFSSQWFCSWGGNTFDIIS